MPMCLTKHLTHQLSLGYLVYYTTDPNQNYQKWVLESVMGTSLTVTVDNLTPETLYYFKVQARNKQGYGPMSSTELFQTPKSE